MQNKKSPRNSGKVILKKEECYCNLAELYDAIAIKLGHNPALVAYDCRKICVTTPVMEEVFSYYKTRYRVTRAAFNQLWLNLGPKANLVGSDYIAQIESGFFLEVRP